MLAILPCPHEVRYVQSQTKWVSPIAFAQQKHFWFRMTVCKEMFVVRLGFSSLGNDDL